VDRRDHFERGADHAEAAMGRGWTPPEAPLDMPIQDIWREPASVLSSRPERRESSIWRIGVIGLTALATAVPAKLAYGVLRIGGLGFLDAVTLSLFVLLFAWIAFGSITAATGFVLLATGGTSPDDTGLDLAPPTGPPTGRCAVLMPVYHEETQGVLARVEAMAGSLDDGRAAGFDFFVLSDSRRDDVRRQEQLGFAALRRRWSSPAGLYYRWRPFNTGRKAGNIAEWVRRFGGGYAYMAVLDADSLMEGETLVRLTAAMDRNPRLGLLQTAPTIVCASSLFARLQQFASRLYGPVHSEGLAWWSGAEGNYWGHNAIIRVRAFAESAGLPSLPGPKPFGGEIMSHDFVEAALLRRAGWEVRMAPNVGGSFEECPPTLSDMLVRERRWCQGNLQHSAIIAARGLHWTSRLHLVRGVSTYLMAPLWMAFVVAASLQALRGDAIQTGEWGSESLSILSWLMLVSLTALAAPKALSLALVLSSRTRRAEWGSSRRLIASTILETILSALVAPVLMAAQIRALSDILLGRDSGWAAQQRDARIVSWREAAGRHLWHTLAGLAFPLLSALTSPAALLASIPAALGLSLSIPIERFTSSVAIGQWLSARGILVIPEDDKPKGVLRDFLATCAPGGPSGVNRLHGCEPPQASAVAPRAG
jgi:membrane glycosyltransferase